MRHDRGPIRIVVEHEDSDVFRIGAAAAVAEGPVAQLEREERDAQPAGLGGPARRQLGELRPQARFDRTVEAEVVAGSLAREEAVDVLKPSGPEPGEVSGGE